MLATLLWIAVWLAGAPEPEEAFRARITVEEGESVLRYDAHFEPGVIRIAPELEGSDREIELILEIEPKRLTLVDRSGDFYCRMSPEEARRLMEAGVIEGSWFPWVADVSEDLMRGVELRKEADGGGRFVLHSPVYGREVAAYRIAPDLPKEIFLQWIAVYFVFWAEESAAQKARLELYANLPGVPVEMEERLQFLSRPRIVRLEEVEPAPGRGAALPEDLAAKDAGALYWESLWKRLLGGPERGRKLGAVGALQYTFVMIGPRPLPAHGTTVLALRREDRTAMAADGQVTLGDTVVKHGARKLRRLWNDKVLAGFAGTTADAQALFTKFESKLEEYRGNLERSAVELAKDWRTDRVLRRLDALLLVANEKHIFLLSGNGDLIEPDDGIAAIGSGGPYALAAARALLDHTTLPAGRVVAEAMRVAAEICIYTNDRIVVEEL